MASCKTKVLLWAVLFCCHFCAGFAAWLGPGKPGWKPAQQKDKLGREVFLQCLTQARWEPAEAQGKGEQFTEENHSSTDLGQSELSYECELQGGGTSSSSLLHPRHCHLLPAALSHPSLTPWDLTQPTNLTEKNLFIWLSDWFYVQLYESHNSVRERGSEGRSWGAGGRRWNCPFLVVKPLLPLTKHAIWCYT